MQENPKKGKEMKGRKWIALVFGVVLLFSVGCATNPGTKGKPPADYGVKFKIDEKLKQIPP